MGEREGTGGMKHPELPLPPVQDLVDGIDTVEDGPEVPPRDPMYEAGKPRGHRWTVIGLYESGKYVNDVFVCYLGGMSAAEARDFAIRTNAERGDKITVLACVAGGNVAHVWPYGTPAKEDERIRKLEGENRKLAEQVRNLLPANGCKQCDDYVNSRTDGRCSLHPEYGPDRYSRPQGRP